MSVSIYFQEFNKEKVDQAWDTIISGKFEDQVKLEQQELEKRLPELEKRIPKYSGEELDFMFYNKDPRYESYAKANHEYEDLIEKAHTADRELVWVDDLNSALKKGDKKEILFAISYLDSNLISKYSGLSYAEYYHGEADVFTQALFEATLGIDLKTQPYYVNEGLSGIPFNLWVDAFKKFDSKAVSAISDNILKFVDYDFESFRDYMLPVRNIIKYCMDNRTEMLISFENEFSKFQNFRAEEIYKRIVHLIR